MDDRTTVTKNVDAVVAAATYVQGRGSAAFDALHLIESDEDTTVSSDDAYEGFTPRLDLKTLTEK